MSHTRGQAPSWLYSFVDLAFLLLITVSQLDIAVSEPVDLGEIQVPEVQSEATEPLPPRSAERWQVRVYPRGETGEAPFALVSSDRPDPSLPPERLDPAALRTALERLRDEGAPKPILAPHEASLSGDLLVAVGTLEDLWPSGRWATVSPLSATP